MKKSVVIFDFDGVIVDSLQLGYSINRSMMPGLQYEEWAAWFDGNIYKNIREEHANNKSQNLFHKEYFKRITEHNPIDGIKETLDSLSKKHDLVIVSSSVGKGIRAFLEKNDLTSHFKDVLGADIHHSKVEKIKLILKRYKTQPQKTLIVTDSVGDIKEAQEVGIGSVAVTWGVHDSERLSKNNPDCLAHSPAEIPACVEKITTG